jgi:hypothetical protein
VTESVLGLTGSGPSSGGNPALPPLTLDTNLVATGGGLTIGRRLAGLYRTPVQISLGADTMFDPNLFSLTLTNSNIGLNAAAISLDNFDSAGGLLNVVLDNNCYSPDGVSCILPEDLLPVVAAAAVAPQVLGLNATALTLSSDVPVAEAGTYMPEPPWLGGVASSIVLLLILDRRRRSRSAGLAERRTIA